MSTLSNISTYESTDEFYVGDLFNIAHDGTAITLGSEPQFSLDTRTLSGAWMFSVIFKTGAITDQCIYSIDDGAGGRFLDIMHTGGDTLTLYLNGETASVVYHTETVPHDEWSFVNIGFESGTGLMHLTGGIAGSGGSFVTTTYTPVTVPVPTIPAGRIFRFFRPAHEDANYFNGSIETYYQRSFTTLLFNHVSAATVFMSRAQAAGWTDNGATLFTGFTNDSRIDFEETEDNGNEYHSFTQFKRNSFIAQTRDNFQNMSTVTTFGTFGDGLIATKNLQVTPSGTTFGSCGYFEKNNLLLYVNDAAELCSFDVVGTNIFSSTGSQLHTNEVVISSDGTYLRSRADPHGRYMFGQKISAGGQHQLYRTDENGLNEITVDCLTLLGVNAQCQGLAIDVDNEVIYFGHPSTKMMTSVAFDLTSNLTTGPVRFPEGVRANIEYSNGHVYWGSQFPNSTVALSTTSFWRINVDTDEVNRMSINFTSDNNLSNFQTIYVDRYTNKLFVGVDESGGKTRSYQFLDTDTENVLGQFYMSRGMQTATSVDIDWVPIDSAVGYKIFQDGVEIESNTANTSLSVTGLTTDTSYKFTLQYTTDGTTFLDNKFYNVVAHLSATGSYDPHLPALQDPETSFYTSECGFVDPYDPKEIYINKANNVYKYNFETKTRTLLGDLQLNVGNRQSRQFSNKNVYHIRNTSTVLYNAGIELSNRIAEANVSAYLSNTDNYVFDHSVTSGGDTANLVSFDSLLDGSSIYYTTDAEELWRWDSATNTSTMIFTGAGTSNMRSLSIDPLNQNDMIFMDDSALIRIDLTTHVTTTVIPNTGNFRLSSSSVFKLYDGVVHGCHIVGSYFRINIDGTGYEDVHNAPNGYHGIYLDTVNHRVILFEDLVMTVIPYTFTPLPPDPSTFSVIARPLSLDMEWDPIDGATKYKVSYSLGTIEDGNDQIISNAGIPPTINHPTLPKIRHSIRNLTPETNYAVSLFYSTTSAEPSLLVGSVDSSTAANLPANYDASSFEEIGGGFDLSALNPSTLATFGEVLNDLFDTGADIAVMVGGITRNTQFMRRGDTLVIPQEEREPSLSIPFVTSAGSGQEASVTLTDDEGVSATFTLEYDETVGSISVDGGVTSFEPGESFILNGKKVTIQEF